MTKKVLAVLLAAAMTLSLAACGEKPAASTEAPATSTEAPAAEETNGPDANGMIDGKFAETRHISVEVFDRGGATPANDNVWTQWIQAQMLEKYNVEVEYVAVDRWSETDQINNLLAASTAPDVCYTYSYPTIQTYAEMGGVVDLNPYLSQYKDMLPNMWELLGDEGIYYRQDPVDGTVLAIEGIRNNIYRINTFVRQDWLDKLGMEAPKTTAEFEAMLVAFKDNADTLLGADASKMIPFLVTKDSGWTAAPIIESKMDPDITDREMYVNGFDDRRFTQNGTKEAMQLLNKWYNDGLMWNDFAVEETSVGEDAAKAGFVGAFCQSYDYPFRNGVDSYNAMLKNAYGEDAKFVSINCFEDKNGKYTHYSYSAAGSDRKVFFPATNDEVLASLLYVDFISTAENLQYLQIGEEGINHTVLESGAIKVEAVSEENVAYTMNSGNNIDITMTCNGLRLVDDALTIKSLAFGYAECDPADVQKAMEDANQDVKAPIVVKAGAIAAESEGTALEVKRDEGFNKSIVAAPADFDSVWDACVAEYLAAGGQAIMDERDAAWVATYGDVDMLP